MVAISLQQSALKVQFHPEAIQNMLQNRNNRFHLDLTNHSLNGVLSVYEQFKRKSSPKFTNKSIRCAISSLEEAVDGTIYPIDVTDEFYVEFCNFLMLTGKNGKARKPSTIRNYFDHIRAALTWGTMHRCPVSETYKLYKLDSYEKTKIALSVSQIAHIYYYDIDSNKERIKELLNTNDHNIRGFSFKNLKKVRDQFVLECNTAQRYSDASRIDPSCFDSTKTVLSIVQQKTGGKAKIFIPKYSIDKSITYDILERYGYYSPCHNMNICNFNKYLHLLLHAIGEEFNQPVKHENKIMGSIVTEEMPLWKCVASHTARRTFVSHWLKEGVSLPQIQKCTGHKDLRSINKYCILDDED